MTSWESAILADATMDEESHSDPKLSRPQPDPKWAGTTDDQMPS